MAATPAATREDGSIREAAEFLEVGGSALFCYTHVPKARPVHACVVICSPLYAEFIRHYRREVILARLLATQGLAVVRFHYRGHGNSSGDGCDATLATMRDDSLSAAEHIARATGVKRFGFLGTRFGALPAAAAASRYPAAPLALWDPVISSSRYIQDLRRVHRMQMLRRSSRIADQADGTFEQRLEGGDVQVLGYKIPRSLFASTLGHDLHDQLAATPRPILLLRLGIDPRLEQGVQGLVESLTDRRWSIESRTVGHREPWWFTSEVVEDENQDQATQVTLEWLRHNLADQRCGM